MNVLVIFPLCQIATLQCDIRFMSWRSGLMCYQLNTIVGVNNWSRVKILFFLPELQLGSYLTISQSYSMCGISYQSSCCLYYYLFMSVNPVVCPCISFPFTSTIGGGDVNAYLVIVQRNVIRHLGLLGIVRFAILLLVEGTNL